jgi:uncharacterized membrane protein
MSGGFLRWLLDLDEIPAGAGSLRLAWERPMPPWVWALLVAAAVLLALWSYRRLEGSRAGRIVLAGARAMVLVLVLVLIAGPMIELPRESVEQDWVMIAVDRSASMSIADGGARDGGAAVRTRDDQLHTIIEDNASMWGKLAGERELRWLGFHAGAFGLGAADEGQAPARGDGARTVVPDLGAPTGSRTDIGAAIEQALQRAVARPVSAIVVMSDGRSSEPPRALLRRLHAEAIPVFVVPLGSPDPLGDLALRRVEAPRRAFIRDKVPVVVELDRFGSAVRDVGATVRLVDEVTGETLDEATIAPGDDREQITLTAEPQLAGEATWRVVVETAEPDLVPENNAHPFLIELVDRPLRVLYVEGYPRWEYRYVKNLLVREKSIDSSVMLLSADRDFAQEGNQPITRLPRSPEELARYDVVILGDVPATFFSPEQLEMIRAHVAERGAGLLWIGGGRSTPQTYQSTALADLLPMRGQLQLPTFGAPVTMQPTDLAERLGVMRIVTPEGVGWPESLRDETYRWSLLHAAQRIEPGRLKPTAEVLAETAREIDSAHYPLVVHLRYGAGQTIYCATDEVWRWRYARGELLPEQFWIQMIRLLGRESLDASGDRAALAVSPRRLEVGQPLRVDLRLLDAQLAEGKRGGVRAVLESEGAPSGGGARRFAEIELRPTAEEARYAATYMPLVTGAMSVRIEDPSLPGLDLSVPVEVYAPDDEMRRPETDHDLLARIADATGAAVLAPSEVGRLPELLPNRAVRTLNPLRERIWDTPLALAVLILALSAEWIGRKIMRLG